MSIVNDQIRHLDALLDRYQLTPSSSRTASLASADEPIATTEAGKEKGTKEFQLRAVVRSLSTTSSSNPLLGRWRLRTLLSQLIDKNDGVRAVSVTSSDPESDLEWLATGKATIQMYGIILNSLLEQTIPLSESIWYWDDVLGSYTNVGLYSIQTAPIRFWKQAQEVYRDTREKLRTNASIQDSARNAGLSISQSWREFYDLVHRSIHEQSLSHARSKLLSPLGVARLEARKNQNKVKKLREMSATAIGLLVDEGLNFQVYEDEDKPEKADTNSITDRSQWRNTVAKSVSLLEHILRNAGTIDRTLPDFEDSVFTSVDGDAEINTEIEGNEVSISPDKLANRLIRILDQHLPQQEKNSKTMSSEFGKPRRLVRYWIPALVLLLSGSTLLRILANRRAEIQQWIRDFKDTAVDFWSNWVIEPIRKLIGTIRHDEQSEIAIMSKDSLKADRESLERMVVDFAIAHPENGSRYTDNEIASIRTKVKEGDLTPVLKAYEREMQSPIKNAVMGDLVRTLLIQVQKTKVDVEVAIGGIDSLLKSQELLFGFVGIAPGVLFSYAVFQWLRGIFGSRKGINQVKNHGETIRLLRNIDRTLNMSSPTESGLLSYRDHGLLLCEVHVLRQRAVSLLPGNVQREFLEDIDDLLDIRVGIDRQIKVVERIQRAYAKWLQ